MLKILIVIIVAVAVVAAVFFLLKKRAGKSPKGTYGNYGGFDYGRDGIRICPHCGERNEADAMFCGGCGANLTSSSSSVCPYCGFPAREDDVFCGNCGAPIGNTGGSSYNGSYADIRDNNDRWGQTEVMGAGDDDATVLMEDYGQTSACLEYFDNGLAQRIHLQREITRIGSKERGTDYVLPSRKVSKLHAQIRREGSRYLLKDLNSTNGTYLNGAPERLGAEYETELHDGDRIRMADIELVFKC